METFVFNVIYNATVTEKTVVTANTKEEAIEKIKSGDDVDIIDDHTETHEIIDIRSWVTK